MITNPDAVGTMATIQREMEELIEEERALGMPPLHRHALLGAMSALGSLTNHHTTKDQSAAGSSDLILCMMRFCIEQSIDIERELRSAWDEAKDKLEAMLERIRVAQEKK